MVVDVELRQYAREHGNARIGEAALSDLERSLKKQGVATVYAVFYAPETIEFFRRNGYVVSSVESLQDDLKEPLGIDPTDFNIQITDDETFEKLRPIGPENYRHILLTKSLTSEATP